MTYWVELFKEWQEMQQRFIDNLPGTLPDFNYPRQNMTPWALPHLQTFMTWGQSAVKQSMELQSHWLEQWSRQMGNTIASSTQSKSDLVNRIHESMTAWSDNQSELWHYWFRMIEETADSMDDPVVLNENIKSWKATVEESLKAQSDWLNQWTREVRVDDLTPAELMNLSIKVQETMNGWMSLQSELWNQWFKFLSLNESKPSIKTSPPKIKMPGKPAVASVTTPPKDNLEVISGIGPALAQKLYKQGITSLRQIAELTEKEIEKLEDTIIKFPGRIRREDWVNQAIKILNEAEKK